jgi:hypothetical protein
MSNKIKIKSFTPLPTRTEMFHGMEITFPRANNFLGMDSDGKIFTFQTKPYFVYSSGQWYDDYCYCVGQCEYTGNYKEFYADTLVEYPELPEIE